MIYARGFFALPGVPEDPAPGCGGGGEGPPHQFDERPVYPTREEGKKDVITCFGKSSPGGSARFDGGEKKGQGPVSRDSELPSEAGLQRCSALVSSPPRAGETEQ